jgi:hypothetical protein
MRLALIKNSSKAEKAATLSQCGIYIYIYIYIYDMKVEAKPFKEERDRQEGEGQTGRGREHTSCVMYTCITISLWGMAQKQ